MQIPLNDLSYKIIGCAYKVHSAIGPGLLESAYQTCLEYELMTSGLLVEKEKPLHLQYGQVKLDTVYRLDLLVEKEIVLEIKSTDSLAPIHKAQMITYLKLANKKLGLLLNFNVTDMKKGIERVVLKEYLHEFN